MNKKNHGALKTCREPKGCFYFQSLCANIIVSDIGNCIVLVFDNKEGWTIAIGKYAMMESCSIIAL